MLDLLGALRKPQPPEFAVEADWPFQSSPSGPVAAVAKLVVEVAAGCLALVAVGFESGALCEEEFDEV